MAPSVAKNGRYDYDLIVIGGGSGGLAASKEAAQCDRKLRIAVFDKVTPSPNGTEWGLGGTCVNVGCIPKKLFHYAGLAGKSLDDFKAVGWGSFERKHNWEQMVENVDNFIRSLNYGYENALRDQGVEYINAVAAFTDPHNVTFLNSSGEPQSVSSERFIIAVGGRPAYPAIPGATLGLSSDDIFWWKKVLDGKTLVVGASYIALECAGFLHELGHDVSVAVRSILLRGFDQQCANQLGEVMEREGVRFLRPAVPERLERKFAGGPITVTMTVEGKQVVEEYNNVLFAVGREPLTKSLGLASAGVATAANGKIVVDGSEATTAKHVFAIGDVICDAKGNGKPELTPVAIQAGQLLARRLFAGATRVMDYALVPTAVFTPLEYGAVGLSQEDAEAALGPSNVTVYATRYGVLETAVAYRDEIPIPKSNHFIGVNLFARNHAKAHGHEWEDFHPTSFEAEEEARKYLKQPCLAKLVCDKRNQDKVLGFHYIGPHAGEITQGFALAVRAGVRKADFDSLVGIHPTSAEEFTSLSITLESGEDFMKKGGC